MKKTIRKVSPIGEGIAREFKIEFPSTCPQCQTALDLSPIYSKYIDNEQAIPNLFVIFFCPHCEICFIGYYHFKYCDYYGDSTTVDLITFEPRQTEDEKDFPKNIKDLSQNFCNIYNQAYASQQHALYDISGMGYRKALEFLVKDYAIILNPEDEEKIKNAPLSRCINDYIDNRRIKKLAIASTWIGNDETHYTKKIQEYNVDDLTAFIDAIVSFINSDLSSMLAEKLIEDKKNN